MGAISEAITYILINYMCTATWIFIEGRKWPLLGRLISYFRDILFLQRRSSALRNWNFKQVKKQQLSIVFETFFLIQIGLFQPSCRGLDITNAGFRCAGCFDLSYFKKTSGKHLIIRQPREGVSSYPQAWAQFCCKMWGGSLVGNQYSHRVDAKVTFYIYRFPMLFLEVFWEQH